MAYFDHAIGGVSLDLAHLEPRGLTLPVRNLGRDLTVDVRFTNHCFTVAFEEGVHDRAALIWDHKRPRAYDRERHELSRGLPAMVDALPGSAVHLTRSDRNYVYFAAVTTPAGQHYPMFFGLRRSPAGAPRDLALVVESAYPVLDRQAVLQGATKIRFEVLCAKVFRGEQVRPQARR